MSTIYVVVHSDYDYNFILGAFKSEESAQAFAKAKDEARSKEVTYYRTDSFDIEEVELSE
jgi:hypothetical protein